MARATEPPPWAAKLGRIVPTIHKNGRTYWGTGRGMRWNAWPAEKDDQLRRMYRKGLTRAVMMHALDVTNSALDRRIRRLKLKGTSIKAVEPMRYRKHVSCKLADDEVAALQRLARQSEMTMSNYMRILIRRAIGFQEKV